MTRSTCRKALLALSLFPLAACGGGGGGGGTSTGSINGTLSVLTTDQNTLEAEPNDGAASSHSLGTMQIGEVRRVLGSITDDGSDPFDGFQIVATQRSELVITLTGDNVASDLDLFLVDPISLLFVDGLDTPGATESGSFVVKGPVYVVLESNSGASDYELVLELRALPNPLPEVESNDTAATAEYLGEMTGGDSLVLSGNSGTPDISDQFLFGFPTSGTLIFDLNFDIGQDLDVKVYDVTAGFGSPTLLGTFDADSTSNGIEMGSQSVSAMTLIAVEVLPFTSSASNWTMTLSVPAPLLAAGSIMPLSQTPRAAEERPLRFMKNAAKVERFTENSAPYLDGEVVLCNSVSSSLDAQLGVRGGRVDLSNPKGVHQLKFDLPPGLNKQQRARYTSALVASMAGVTGTVYAEPNYLYQPSAVETRPNDNFYNLQWHYEAMNLPAAWDLETGDASIIVAILDTGSTPHPDLDGREIAGFDMISNPSIAGDGDGFDSDPFDVGDGSGPQPSSYHGSHVAGTVGAETNNGDGVAGVTWAGAIMHVRLLGIGGGSNFDIANGILYTARLANSSGALPAQRAHIMNMSLGGPGFSQSMQNAVTDARNAGVVIIAAAGNENSSTPSYPAAYDGVLSVAAVGFDLSRAPYSNFHPTVDLAAPGGNVSVDLNGDGYGDGVLSTKPDDSSNPINFASYSFYQGTSMAAPHVAGVAALLLSQDNMLTVPQVESILINTVTDLGAAGKDNQFGHGLVNAFAAVQQAAGGGMGAPVLSLGESTILLNANSGVVCRNVAVSNGGGTSLAVSGTTVSTTSGGMWLAATPIAALSGTSTDTSAIEICVDPAGLADGTYRGTVDVQSNGGTVSVSVVMTVGSTVTAPNYLIYIVAVNSDTLESVAQTTVMSQGSLGYNLGSLPAGSYFIVAGTDEDNDGTICDPGEPLCGVYPSLELPSVLEVVGGSNVAGRDFPLQGSFTTATVGNGGFKRFRTPDEMNDQNGVQVQAIEAGRNE